MTTALNTLTTQSSGQAAFTRPRMLLHVFLLLLATTASHAESGKFVDIVQIAPDTYQISRTDHWGIFGNASKMKTAVLKEAQAFAESQGKVAVVQAIRELPMINGRNFASVEYTFFVLDKADAEAKRARLVREPDLVTEQRLKVGTSPEQPATKPDLYADLLKLDDLRKRGVITEVEFEQQKKKLLAD